MKSPDEQCAIITITAEREGGLLPSSYPAHELAEVLEQVEAVLLPIIQEKIADKTATVSVCLTEIQQSSVKLRFESNPPGLTHSAQNRVAGALRSKTWAAMPPESMRALQGLYVYAKKRERRIWFAENGDPREGAVIDRHTEMPAQEQEEVCGETTLYGILVDVGGVTPKLTLQLPGGKSLNCQTSKELAKQACSRLYEWIGVFGNATWSVRDWTIVKFDVLAISAYRDTTPKAAMDGLRAIVDGKWDAVDVEQFMGEMRGADRAS